MIKDFFYGVVRAYDILAVMQQYDSRESQETQAALDYAALSRDWQQVGADMRYALNAYGDERGKRA